ncbi:MAG: hypothetical protein HOP08_04775 [Cyclobacteriaceae bacterium]|nr:hypothetical protein [Cyclobacteriaceae bacterium]
MDWSLPLLIQKPAYQALLFLLLTPIVILVTQPRTADKAWQIAAYVFIVFLIVNAGLLWFSDSPWRYFFYSIGFAIGYLLLIAIMMPVLLKALRPEAPKSEESAMAFLILIYQPFALLLVMVVKWIMTKWF